MPPLHRALRSPHLASSVRPPWSSRANRLCVVVASWGLTGCQVRASAPPEPPPRRTDAAGVVAPSTSPAQTPTTRAIDDDFEARIAALLERVHEHDGELVLQAIDALSRRHVLLVDQHPEHPRVVEVTSRLEVLVAEAERSVAIGDAARRVAEGLAWEERRLRAEQAEAADRYGSAHPHMRRLSVQLALLDRLMALVGPTDVERLDVVDLWLSKDETTRILRDAERRFASGHEHLARLRADLEGLERALGGRRPRSGDCSTLQRAYDLRLAYLRGQREAMAEAPTLELDLRIDGLVMGRARTLAELSCGRSRTGAPPR